LLLALIGGLILYFALLCALRVLTSRSVARIPRFGPALARIVKWMPFAV
jgi:stage V sporulation protein B